MRRYDRADAARLQNRDDRTEDKRDAQDRRQDPRPAQVLSRDPLSLIVDQNSGADESQIAEDPCKNE